MDKDRVEGKVKDIAGSAQRKAGEWTDNPEQQAKGAAKQAEGKVQNAYGKVKDAVKNAADKAKQPHREPQEDVEEDEGRRTG